MAFLFRSKKTPPAPKPTPTDDPGAPIAPMDAAVEARIQEIGRELLSRSRDDRSGLLSAAFWSDKLMDWAMKDEAFKVQLFRFVDAFPMLRTPQQIHEHLADYLSQPGVTPPPGMDLMVKAGGVAKGVFAKTMAGRITGMAEKFIAGTDAQDALPVLRKLWKKGLAFSVDLLGEACVSDAEAEAYRTKYLDLIENLPTDVNTWAPNERLDRDHLGPIPRTNVSIKISSLFARTDPIDFKGSLEGLVDALSPVLNQAAKNNVLINFDMEHYAFKDLTLELFMQCCERIDFPAGLAMQAYLRSGDEDAQRIIEWTRRTGRQITVRLVKGAYWDHEIIHAEEMGWPVPVWSRKCDSDACFERMSRALIQATPRSQDEGGVKVAIGSHNARSIAAALAELEKAGLPQEAIELQMLYGMAAELKQAACGMGLRVREYLPVGEMIPGMAYLVRRLLENTSNESWLRAGFMDGVDESALLASPHLTYDTDPGVERIQGGPERHALSSAVEGVGDGRPFFTEAMRDFAEADQREAFAAAISAAKVPAVTNDGTEADVKTAIDTLSGYFPTWRDTPVRERANILVRAANIMRSRRDELSGVIIRESGKPWREADGDVCEAIDFLEYYAREAVGLFEPRRLGRFVGEIDEVFHQPRGVAVIISPWNFPLAICTGMTAAALVTGNPALVKPAEQTPGIAKLMFDILMEAGCPPEACIFLPGQGEVVGAAAVRDPRTALIAFTGSMAVGLNILEVAGTTGEDQSHVKKVVCEMGGKNAVIIDASADLDEAVLGVRQSAFGFSGQKCSACSRAIVLETAYDTFLERIVESTRSLKVGNPLDPGTDVGPVIDEDAKRKIQSYIDLGSEEGTLEIQLSVPEGLEQEVGLPYVGPAIISGIEPHHRLAREEVFGPVLAVIKVKDFDEALQVANSTEYKLTGGVFSRKPSNLERARWEYRVGNLYLNRGITGALVGRQPFGGFGMSGVGTKAGGDEYLLHFVEPRCVTENATRRGFAPGLHE
ncbi:MAG: proline dehydrogenase family protein [Phycisphaerales bacterium]|nr:proline dehydrogenase family protein [Phycisphaerales bacterium]